MKTLAQNLKIGGTVFPTIQSIQSVTKLDKPGAYGSPLLVFGLQVLITAAVAIALVSLIWGGISWTMSGGDKTKLQAARNTVLYAIVGLITSFLSFLIVNLIGYFFLGGANMFGQ
jgi:hypothetical protein